MDPLALLLKKNPKPGKPKPKPPRKPPAKGYKGMAYEPGTKNAKHATEKVRAEIKKSGARIYNQVGGQIHIAATDKQAAALRKKRYGVFPMDLRNQDLPSARWTAKQGEDYKLWALVAWDLPESIEMKNKPIITEDIGVDLGQFRELTGIAPPAHGGLKVMGEQHYHAAVEAGVSLSEALRGKPYILDQLRRALMAAQSGKLEIAMSELEGIRVEKALARPLMRYINEAVAELMDGNGPKATQLIDRANREAQKLREAVGGPQDGRGAGQGAPKGGRRNKNRGSCSSGGPGGGKGGGRGKGAGREAVGAGFDEAGKDKRRKELERLVWKHTHRDSKGKYNGEKTVLYLGPKGTTMIAISDMSDEQLLKKIPSRYRPESVRDDFYGRG